MLIRIFCLTGLMLGFSAGATAGDVLTQKNISLDLAADIARETVQVCRKQGYQVSAVVVDRNGLMRVALRDDLAPRFTLQIAEDKANLVIMGGVNSGEVVKNRADIRTELNHIDGLIMMRGGVQITSGGSYIGAIGVSGAPGGEKDEACAMKSLDKYAERLEFAE